MLEFVGELVLEILGSAMPPSFARVLFILFMFGAAIVCFGFGGWILYRAVTDPTERPFLYLTGIAWFVGAVLTLIGWIALERREA